MEKMSIQSMFDAQLRKLQKEHGHAYRAKPITMTRVYQACGLIDTMSEDTTVNNVVFLIDPQNGFDADVCAEMGSLTIDCRRNKDAIDALTCADSLTFSQSESGNLRVVLHFNDLWVITRNAQ